MKLSSKEKILLSTLGGLLIGIGYYKFIFSPQLDDINNLNQKKIELETEYNEVMNSMALLKSRQQEVKDLLEEINRKTKKFYPSILQEQIILELNQYLNESYMQGDITFNEISVKSVEKFKELSENLSESTFQDLVDKYKGTKEDNNKETSNETNEDSEANEDSEINEDSEEDEVAGEKSEATIKMLKATVNFKGTYQSLKKFIAQIEVSNRQVLITDLSADVGDNGELSGTINLEYYAIPKLSSSDSEYLTWKLKGNYGKQVPFLIQEPQTVEEDIESTQATSDFAVIVKSIDSDLPNVMIGKSTDTSQSTYITNKDNGIQNATIEFTKVDGKYYCKYKLGEDKLSEGYNGNGISFTPSGENIIIDVSSEKRNGVDDKVGLNLNVINKTDKIVQVKIANDDSDARVAVTGDSKNIKVTRR